MTTFSIAVTTSPRPRSLSRKDRQWIYANCCARLEAHGVNPRRAKTVTAVYEYLERLSAVFPDNTDADDPMVNPSVERIAEETRSSVRGVKNAIARLTELGLVRTRPAYRPGGVAGAHQFDRSDAGLARCKHSPS